MAIAEIKVGQYFFSPDEKDFRTEAVPLRVKPDGSVETRKERIRREASEIPPVPEDLSEPSISPNGLRVLEARYLIKDEQGEVAETPQELFWRVANIAKADELHNGDSEKTAREFYEVMAGLKFLPNSPTLMNAGGLQQLSACFVLPVEDDMRSIMDAAKATALIHQSGGGTGFSFSKLRPEGSLVKSSGGRASGPLSFMKIFNATTEQVKQGGRRRGANMAVLRVDHPDIKEFIAVKQEPGRLKNFNISVVVTDEFMRAVKEDGEYELVNPHTGGRERIRAKPIFDLIAQSAWKSGEPGIVFIDEINRKNPTKHLGEIESTNPCGEQPLHPFESCNLGSINLAKMVKDGGIDWQELERVTKTAVHFLDNVIDMNRYPLPEIEEKTLGNRRIGLGIMGFADMLVQLGVAYDSEEGIKTAEEVMRFIQEKGHKESERLAKERGVFPNWEGSDHQKAGRLMRNATVTTIAPTGSIGIIAGCSQGCEPHFALSFERRGLLDGETTIVELNPYLLETARQFGLSEDVMERIKRDGRLRHIDEVPEEMKKNFATAHDVLPEWHIWMQAALQKYTDNAVSKTINLPNEATVEDIAQAYLLAYELDCKGLTVYRDRSREEQVLYAGERKPLEVEIRPRPEVIRGETHRIETPVGTAFTTINFNGEGKPFEVFINVGKAGSDVTAFAEGLGRMLSLFFRSHPEVGPDWLLSQVVDQLQGIGGTSSIGFGKNKVRSLPDAIAAILQRYLRKEGFEFNQESKPDICPECLNASFIQGESCQTCQSCGFSIC